MSIFWVLRGADLAASSTAICCEIPSCFNLSEFSRLGHTSISHPICSTGCVLIPASQKQKGVKDTTREHLLCDLHKLP